MSTDAFRTEGRRDEACAAHEVISPAPNSSGTEPERAFILPASAAVSRIVARATLALRFVRAATKRCRMRFVSSKKAKPAKEQAKTAKDKIPGAGKVKKLLGDFDSAMPVLKDLGYQLSDATIKLAIPPSLTATFEVTRDPSEKEVSDALQKNKDRKLVKMLIRMLSKARQFQNSVHVAGLKPQSTAVEIGLLGTGVALKFA